IAGAGGLALLGVAGLGRLVTAVASVRTAMQALGVSARAAGLAVAGIGGILALGAWAINEWASAAAEADRRATDVADTLDELNGAITGSTEAWINDELVRSGVAGWYKNMGGDVRDLTDAVLGEADAI